MSKQTFIQRMAAFFDVASAEPTETEILAGLDDLEVESVSELKSKSAGGASAQVASQVTDLTNRIAALEAALAGTEETTDESGETVAATDGVTARIAALESGLSAVENSVSELDQTTTEQVSQIAGLSKEVSSLKAGSPKKIIGKPDAGHAAGEEGGEAENKPIQVKELDSLFG